MFTPPRCPYADCVRHADPQPGFFVRNGHYRPKCRAVPVPRFICRSCDRGFSRQTFRADFRDHRPDLNGKLFHLLVSGIGLRQSARLLEITPRCLELKFRKIARHLLRLQRNLTGDFRGLVRLQMDEMETFEGNRRTRPLTLPIVIHEESMFILDARSAPIRPSGPMPKARKRAIARDAKRFGVRKNESIPCLKRVLGRVARHCESASKIVLTSDEKTVYPGLARRAFGKARLTHETYSSKMRRDTANPLFRINLTNAMARDNNGRLRRRSWLASKLKKFLNLQLGVFMVYRNFIRPRFNRDRKTPAEFLGFTKAPLTMNRALSWRQDWGRRSPDVRGNGAQEVAAWS